MRRWTKRILIVIAVFVMPVAGLFFFSRWQGERELSAVLEELDASESPWRWDDLIAARPKLTKVDDARAVVTNTRQLASGFSARYRIWEKALFRPPNAIILPDDFEPFDTLMKGVEPALDEGRKLGAMTDPRFPLVWPDNPVFGPWDDTQKARELISILQCAAVWRAQHGDLDGALDDCLAMQRACQSLGDEPGLIVHLVRIAMQAISMPALERVVAQGQPSPQKLDQVQRAWEQFDRERAMIACLRGERASSHRLFEAIANGSVTIHQITGAPKDAPIAVLDRVEGLYYFSTSKQAHAWTLRRWGDFLRSMELPEPERAKRQLDLAKETTKAPRLAKMLMPAFEKTMHAHRRGEAQVRSAIVGLAAERFRRETGHWPKTLPELCPKFLAVIPQDPYTGKPLQLRHAPDGIVIYSVGPEGTSAGDYQEKIAAGQSVVSNEFRLWNVTERRKQIVRKSE